MRTTLSILVLCLFSTAIVSGCTGKPQGDEKTTHSQPEDLDKAAAELQLQRMLSDKAAKEERARRIAEQRAAQAAAAEAARQAELAKPHYPPAVLESAARPRVWGPANIEGMGIECHLNSRWIDGHVDYRVALLGQHLAIEQFMMHRKFYVNFQDQSGANTFAFEITPQDFTWDPPNVNGGIPTMETRGQVDCPDLNAYSMGVQWDITFID